MKVAINARFILPRLEGIGHYTVEIVDHLSKSHPEDEFHLIMDRSYHLPIMDRRNVRVHVLKPPARHPLLWYYWFEHGIPQLLEKIKPDVFFSPDGYNSLNIRIPSVMTIHDLAYLHFPKGTKWTHRIYLHYFLPRYLKHAHLITCVSEYTRLDVQTKFQDISDKLVTIPNGVSHLFKPLSNVQKADFRKRITQGRPYFLYLGSIHPRKNVKRLIQGFDSFKKSSGDTICLVLAGRFAWDTRDVKEAMNRSQFKEDIIHIEFLDEIITDLVAAATALCYLSLFEGFGLPVLEAMACGVPVITSEQSAMSEVCGAAALYVNPYKLDDIAAKLSHVRKNEKDMQHFIELGLKRAKQYSWENTSLLVYKYLRQVSME